MKRAEEGHLKHSDITPGEDANFPNARKHISKGEIKELAEDIALRGLLYPLLIWEPDPKDEPGLEGKHVLIGGSRRYAAVGLLIEQKEWKADREIPVRYVYGTKLDAQMTALADNIKRENLSVYDVSSQLVVFIEKDGLKVTEVADKLGYSPAWVSQRYNAFKKSSPALKAAWRERKIPDKDALDIAAIDNPKEQDSKLKEVLDLRETGGRKAASKARELLNKNKKRKSKGRPTPTQVGMMKETLSNVNTKSDRYLQGMKDMLEWMEGEIGDGEFDKSYAKHIEPIIEKKNTENEKRSTDKTKAKRAA